MPIDSRSRVEDILNVILGNLDPSVLQPPQSRVEDLLQKLNEMISDFDGKIPVHICTYDEYDHETLMPTIEDPDENTFYLVPAGESGSSDDMYIEWIFTEGNRWERFGSGGGTVTIEQSDWNQNDSTQADFIKNKPDLTLKLDKNQGVANHGRVMTVNNSGVVVPAKFEGGNITVTETLETGEDYSLGIEGDGTGGVSDVKVGGATVVNQGVANIPLAGTNSIGAVKIAADYGLVNDNELGLKTDPALAGTIKTGLNTNKPIVPSTQHNSVFYGLAKAAGDATQSSSANTVGTYTDAAKDKILSMLGVSDLIAASEGSTASKAYSVGEMFIFNGKLHEATDTIAIGDAIVSGINCDVVLLGDKVTDLKSQMSAVDAVALGAYPTDTVSGSAASFSDGADSIPVKNLVIAIEPAQSGSGDPSPDNVRPISGWTGANVTLTGKNLVNITGITTGVFTTRYDFPKPIAKSVTISAKNNNVVVSEPVWRVQVIYKDGTSVYIGDTGYTGGTFPKTFSATEANPIVAIIYRGNAITSGSYDLIVAFGDEADYEPYQGQNLPITFPAEAGTVYGGTLDVTTGVLTVDRAIKTYTGVENWASYNGYNGFSVYNDNMKDGMRQFGISNYLKFDTGTHNKYGLWLGVNNHIVYAIEVADVLSEYTVNAWKAYLSEHPLQIVYPLATPQTYQLTPVEVLTLLGANTIYADTGDTTVNYRADPTLYADKRSKATRSIIAGIEPTMTASKAYTVGQLLIVGDTLYKVAASIASGATLTPGTNVNPTTVAEQLILLANA